MQKRQTKQIAKEAQKMRRMKEQRTSTNSLEEKK